MNDFKATSTRIRFASCGSLILEEFTNVWARILEGMTITLELEGHSRMSWKSLYSYYLTLFYTLTSILQH